MKVFLVGPTAVGKSTVGSLLARRLGVPFVDADELVAAQAGMPVQEIFARKGERFFRELERQAVRTLARLDNLVAALGGGAILDPGVREEIRREGRVIGLKIDERELIERLRRSPRPVLPEPAAEGFEAVAGELIRARLEACRELGPLVDISGCSPGEAVERVLGFLSAAGKAGDPEAGDGWGWQVRLPGPSSAVLGRRGAVVRPRRRVPGPDIPGYWSGKRVLLVSSPLPYSLYGNRLAELWRQAGARVDAFLVPEGEKAKSSAWLFRLWRRWTEARVDREALVAAVGGGAVSDLAGLAAATYLRGLEWAVIPTTLLAQADAALGGKVAIDLPQGKNLVGAFHQPRWILVDAVTLLTLPAEQLRAGLAEVVKCALLEGEEFWDWLQTRAGGLLAKDPALLDEAVRRCLSLKTRVVEQDEKEAGPRQLLNLGHTVGHALEAATGWLHGEAVAVGLVAACEISCRLACADPELPARVRGLLGRLGLPVNLPRGRAGEVEGRLGWDKKARGGEVRFVLPRRPGEVIWGVSVPPELVREVLKALEGET